GYIASNVYDTTGAHLIRRSTALRPSDCDPATAADHCRQTPESLSLIDLVATDAFTETTYEYGDPYWPDRPTVTTTKSVLSPAGTRIDTVIFDATTGSE